MIFILQKKEPKPRLELGTSSLPRKCSTAELFRQNIRAEDGAQTRDPQLGRLMLYQLSYFRILHLWAVMDSNHRRRKPAELQSAPFGHSGNCPSCFILRCKGKYYFCNLQEKSIIFIAVTAASSPLFPYLPPARSSDCCMLSVVNNPKMNGISYFTFNSVIPCVTPEQT